MLASQGQKHPYGQQKRACALYSRAHALLFDMLKNTISQPDHAAEVPVNVDVERFKR